MLYYIKLLNNHRGLKMSIVKIVANDISQQSQVFKTLKSFGFITDELKKSKPFTVVNTAERSIKQFPTIEYHQFHLIDGLLVADVAKLGQVLIKELSDGNVLPTGIYYTGYGNMGNMIYEMTMVSSSELCVSDEIEFDHEFNDGCVIVSNNGVLIPTEYDLAFIGNKGYFFKKSKNGNPSVLLTEFPKIVSDVKKLDLLNNSDIDEDEELEGD